MTILAVYAPRSGAIVLADPHGRTLAIPLDEAAELAAAILDALQMPARAQRMMIVHPADAEAGHG